MTPNRVGKTVRVVRNKRDRWVGTVGKVTHQGEGIVRLVHEITGLSGQKYKVYTFVKEADVEEVPDEPT